MDIHYEINELKKIIAKYDLESFVGFCAYFIKHRANPSANIPINKLDSNLKDLLYLIGLKVSCEHTESVEFKFEDDALNDIIERLNRIKSEYRNTEHQDYTEKSAIHEMAFRNRFDNGVLSYSEQDIEKVRVILDPFSTIIYNHFDLTVEDFISIYYAINNISRTKFIDMTSFFSNPDFIDFKSKFATKETDFELTDILPSEATLDAFGIFRDKPYECLLFSREELYVHFSKNKIDRFLKLLSYRPHSSKNVFYYTDANPFESNPILELPNSKFLSVYEKQVPIAIYSLLYEFVLNNPKLTDKLKKHRSDSLENKVSEIFNRFFQSKETFYYENYSIDSGPEQDLLILHKGVAIIVEIKSSRLRDPFRDTNKAILRLQEDFTKSIQHGYDQCLRVEDFFYGNSTFSITDNRKKILYKVNPKKYHSIYSIVVTLERFGSLQTDLNLMLKKDPEFDFPWSVYIDDLETFLLAMKASFKNHQLKLFDFLKNRRLLHGRVYATDELDICASYLVAPQRFSDYARKQKKLVSFSTQAQNEFDKLYFSGSLSFKYSSKNRN